MTDPGRGAQVQAEVEVSGTCDGLKASPGSLGDIASEGRFEDTPALGGVEPLERRVRHLDEIDVARYGPKLGEGLWMALTRSRSSGQPCGAIDIDAPLMRRPDEADLHAQRSFVSLHGVPCLRRRRRSWSRVRAE